ncbi:hypothetical protein [Burkholderia ubonensis]|uniref:hypothetical protein n=1 Tax=Burkholderia ubonensis TaxID=101571 RepID=UPI001E549047|nr:hypothetical protein [Burkholderia ubonensis]
MDAIGADASVDSGIRAGNGATTRKQRLLRDQARREPGEWSKVGASTEQIADA